MLLLRIVIAAVAAFLVAGTVAPILLVKLGPNPPSWQVLGPAVGIMVVVFVVLMCWPKRVV